MAFAAVTQPECIQVQKKHSFLLKKRQWAKHRSIVLAEVAG